MSSVNKKRVPNFSTQEKMVLIELIDKKKDIIENKQTDAVTVKDKEKCWLLISREFNSRGILAYRNVTSLKYCWDNLKKKTRKHYADIRKEGGGKVAVHDEDPVAERVKAIIQPSVECLKKTFESDNIGDNDPHNNDNIGHKVEAIDKTDFASNWADWTPTMLKLKKSTELDYTVSNDEELLQSSANVFGSYIDKVIETSAIETWNAASHDGLTAGNKSFSKQGERTKTSTISAIRRNHCFYDLARSKVELVELMKDDLLAKSRIEMEILKTRLEKEKLEVDLLKKKLEEYRT